MRKARVKVVAGETLDDGGAVATPACEAVELPVPQTPDELQVFLRERFGLTVPGAGNVPGHSSPMEYLAHTFFEGRFGRGPGDLVLWANRGGGKTFLGAVATLLDLMFKPGIEVRILAGSLQQASRMHEHLRTLCEHEVVRALAPKHTARALKLANGSRAEILAASQTAVRGSRVQKLRCDEVDLFRQEIWAAAQLTTRSMKLAGPWGEKVAGTVEALSTMHVPMGMMWSIVSDAVPASGPRPETPAKRGARVLFRWGVMGVLEKCPPQRPCAGCELWDECQGAAKGIATTGHISIDDAIAHKGRIALAQWQAEGLCLRPTRSDAVFPGFSEAHHLYGAAGDDLARAEHQPGSTLLAGMDFGFRSPTTVIYAVLSDDGVLRVVDATSVSSITLAEHLLALQNKAEVLRRATGCSGVRFIGVDPAGNQRSAHSGVSSIAALRQAGWVVRARGQPIASGLEVIRQMLERAESGRGGQAAPMLLIHRRCSVLIEALHRYHFAADRPYDTQPVKDGPDHAVDALRYLVTNMDGVLPGSAAVCKRFIA